MSKKRLQELESARMADRLLASWPVIMAGPREQNLHKKYSPPIIMTFLQSLTDDEWTTFREGLREPMTEQQIKEIVLNIVRVVTGTALKFILPKFRQVMMIDLAAFETEDPPEPITQDKETRSQISLSRVQMHSPDHLSPLMSVFGITEGSILDSIRESLEQALGELDFAYSSPDSHRLVPAIVKEVLSQVNVAVAVNIPMTTHEHSAASLPARPAFPCQETAKNMISVVTSQLTTFLTGLSLSSNKEEADSDSAVTPTTVKVIAAVTEIIHSCLDEEDRHVQDLLSAITEKVKALLSTSGLGSKCPSSRTSSHDIQLARSSINDSIQMLSSKFSKTAMKAVSVVLRKRLSSDAGFDQAGLDFGPVMDEGTHRSKATPQIIDLISSELIETFVKGMESEITSFRSALAKHSPAFQSMSATDGETLNKSVMSSVNNVYAVMLGKVRSLLSQILDDHQHSSLAHSTSRARENESVKADPSHAHRPPQRSQSESQVPAVYPPEPCRAVSQCLLSRPRRDTCTMTLFGETFTNLSSEEFQEGAPKAMNDILPQAESGGYSAQELGSQVSRHSADSMSIERPFGNLVQSLSKLSCESFNSNASQTVKSAQSLPTIQSFSHACEPFRTYSGWTLPKENVRCTSLQLEDFAQWISTDFKTSTKEVICEILHTYRVETSQESIKEQVLDTIPVMDLFVEAVIRGLEDMASSGSSTPSKKLLASSTQKTLSKQFLAKATQLTSEVLQKSLLGTSDLNEITTDFPGRIGPKGSLEDLTDPETTARSMMTTVVKEMQVLTQFSDGRAESIEDLLEKNSKDSSGSDDVLAGSPLTPYVLDVKTSSAAQNVFQSWRTQLANLFTKQAHPAVKNKDSEDHAKGAIKKILLAIKASISISNTSDEAQQVNDMIDKMMEDVGTVQTETGHNLQSTNLKPRSSSQCSRTSHTDWYSRNLPPLPGTPVLSEVIDNVYCLGKDDDSAYMEHITSSECEVVDSLVETLVDTIDSERGGQAITPYNVASFAERLELDAAEVTVQKFSHDLADKIHSVLATMSHLAAGKSWSDSVLETKEYRNAEAISSATYKIISVFAEKSVKRLLCSCLFSDVSVDEGTEHSAHDAVASCTSSCVITPIIILQNDGQIWKCPSETFNNMVQQFTTVMVNQVMESVSVSSSGSTHFENAKSQSRVPSRAAVQEEEHNKSMMSHLVISLTSSTSIDVGSGPDDDYNETGIRIPYGSDKMSLTHSEIPAVSPSAVHHCLRTVFLKVQKTFCTGVSGSQRMEPWRNDFSSVAECVLGLLSTASGVSLEDRMDLPKELHGSVIEAVYDELLRRIEAMMDVNVVQAFSTEGQMLAGALTESIVKAIQRKDLAQFLYSSSTHGSLDPVSNTS